MTYLIFFGKLVMESLTVIGSLIVIVKLYGVKLLSKAIETQLKESVKKGFNESLESFKSNLQVGIAKEIEPLKATLSRSNIDFQVSQTEYVKRQFLHLEELFSKAYEIKTKLTRKSIRGNSYLDLSSERIALIKELVEAYVEKAYISSFYLDDLARQNIFQYSTRVLDFMPVFKEHEYKKEYYHALEGKFFIRTYATEDGEITDELLSDEEISTLKDELMKLKKLCDDLERACDNDFISVDNAIRSILHKTSY